MPVSISSSTSLTGAHAREPPRASLPSCAGDSRTRRDVKLGAGRGGRRLLRPIAAIETQLKGIEYVVPKRDTFYGMTEVIVRDPAGHVVAFAQQTKRS